LKLESLANRANIARVFVELRLFPIDVLDNYTCLREELTTIHNEQIKSKYVNSFARDICEAIASQYTK
jgi:hypothetical protein